MSVSQTQIAKELGISQRAVSAAIRNDGRVSESTRKRVLQTARKLGYRPNTAARAARTGKFGAIGLVRSLESAEMLIHHSALVAIDREAAEHDLHVVSGLLPGNAMQDENELPRILREWSVDGLLMSYDGPEPLTVANTIKHPRVPVVWVNQKMPEDCVRPDDYQAALSAVEELLALGHRRITMIQTTGQDQSHYSRLDRIAGYAAAMRQAGLSPDVQEVSGASIMSGGQAQAGYGRLEEIMGKGERPTAVVTCMDMPTVMTAYRLGLSLPGDLSVIAIRDKGVALGPQELSARINPMYDVGRRAVQMLTKRINKPGRSSSPELVPFQIVPGQTVAPHRDST